MSNKNKHMKFKKFIKDFYKAFEKQKRDNETEFWSLKETYIFKKSRPEFLELIHKAHLDEGPNDFVYEKIHDFLGMIIDKNVSDPEEARDLRDNFDSDVYNHDLLKWIGGNLYRAEYCNEWLNSGVKDFWHLLGYAQVSHMEEIYCALLDGIENYLEGNAI